MKLHPILTPRDTRAAVDFCLRNKVPFSVDYAVSPERDLPEGNTAMTIESEFYDDMMAYVGSQRPEEALAAGQGPKV